MEEPDRKAEAGRQGGGDKQTARDRHDETTGPEVVPSALDAPVIFVDNLYHLTWSDNVVKLAFVQYLGDPPKPGESGGETQVQLLKARHVASVAMSFDALTRMSDYLQSSIEFLREHGPLK